MSTETAPETIPAGPTDDRERAFLAKIVDLSEKYSTTLREAMEQAESRLLGLANGIVSNALTETGTVRTSAEALGLHAELTTRQQLARAYGITAEQVQYAIRLGSSPHGSMSEQCTKWLFSGK